MKPSLGRRVTVLGIGISGLESALFLKRQGFDVFLSEKNQSPETEREALRLKSAQIEFEIGSHDAAKILSSDWVVTSPGIAPSSPLIRELDKKKVPVISEIETAYYFCKSKKIIAVTGTAGKTTAATLIHRCLQRQGMQAHCCGNIGNPWVGELDRIHAEHYVVMELSSFQLHYTQRFRPWIGVLLNISPNHLDWHETMEHYVQSKLKIFSNQKPGDFSVFYEEDQRRYFPGACFSSTVVSLSPEPGANSTRRLVHTVSKLLDLPQSTVDEVFQEFRGIEHRLESVAHAEGAAFINDSKSTTPLSIAYALERYGEGRVLLLAGGRAKSKNFDEIGLLLQRKVRRAYVYGESADLLQNCWDKFCSVRKTAGIAESLEDLKKDLRPGDVVLLSPGCASFDQFKNYQDRGCFYKRNIQRLWPQAVLSEPV